jgi:hypothetical protein
LAVRIRNQKYSHRTLGLSTPAWREMLKLAMKNGWQPLGSVLPEFPPGEYLYAGFSSQDWVNDQNWEAEWPWAGGLSIASRPEFLLETYLPLQPDDRERWANGSRLVLLEDALNFVDALDTAYQAYEPVRVPADYFLFEPEDAALSERPSLGALAAAIEVCRQGSFTIEPWRTRG